MSDEVESTTDTSDGIFSIRTKILEHIVRGSEFEQLAADDAWI